VKKIAMQRCCTTPVMLKQYETSTDAVLRALGVEPIDIKGFGCCGYPLKNFDFNAYILSSAKNMSLAESRDLNMLTFCNCCYGSLRRAHQFLKKNDEIRSKTNDTLKQEGLNYRGKLQVQHLLHFLYHDIGKAEIVKALKYSFEGLKIATHYGCQILRPWEDVGLKEQRRPVFFDELVEITGASSIEWSAKFDCCGAPVWGINNELSGMLLEKKIQNAMAAGADVFCVACPFCQFQFGHVQKFLFEKGQIKETLPSILYTQLLGLVLGLDESVLGIDKNRIHVPKIRDCIKGSGHFPVRSVEAL